MNTIEQMLRHLTRPGVTELALASDRLPCVKLDGEFKPIDSAAPSTPLIRQMLAAAGGSQHLGSLSPRPTQWTLNVFGVGTVTASAVLRDSKILARFVLTQREAPAEAPPPGASSSSDLGGGGFSLSLDPAPAATPASSGLSLDSPSAPGGSAAPPSFSFSLEPTSPAAASPSPTGLSLSLEPTASAASDLKSPGGFPTLPSLPHGITRLEPILTAARDVQASDLHIVATRPLLFRIAGELLPHGEVIEPERVEQIVLHHIPARCQEGLEKEGACDFSLQLEDVGRFRVNVTRQRTGLKACFRVIPAEIPTLASLGLPEEIAKATHHHQGLIVVTGPTGHGKTSTLAAIIDIINRETSSHVITVEDPIEYVHPQKRALISQREVGTHTLSFQNAIKASLREDPDVVVVGELRDTETVRMALSASETGHLVLGTMNTPSAAKTIDRLIDLFPPGDQQQVRMTLAGGLRLIVSQRLLPMPDGSRMVAAAELLPGNIALWSLIRDNKTFQIPSLQQRGKAFGIIRLDDSLAELVRAGKTTRDAALSMAESPDELAAALGRPAGAAAPAAAAPAAAPGATPEPQKAAVKAAPQEKAPGGAGGLLGRAGALFGGKKG